MKMKLLLFSIAASIILFSATHFANAESPNTLSKLDKIADQSLQLAKAGKLQDSEQMMKYFSKQLTDFEMKERPFSMDEMTVLTVSYNQALKAIESDDISAPERLRDMTAFRLVVDALNSQYQPMWSEMESKIMTAFNGVKEAAEKGSQDDYHYKLNTFLSQYATIQPSLKVDISPERLQKIDAKITYIDQYRDIRSNSDQLTELALLQTDLNDLFSLVNKDEADPSLWWVMLSTGGIIIFTLSYVGWRKYKGQNEEKQTKEGND
ncbi:sporulation protein YpjB [Falsibacillus pallidus]|uniref:Sporulation protein YpjB n=1 Tax=Falsibacillus pallidus TaxID=493781 RepID=A0A370GH71_9BACI|nr:sporulation protein YpjB [Falsibacillus pallidus]RDI43007.1 sporulation protein YpjB [Falsibacillus pallidus]